MVKNAPAKKLILIVLAVLLSATVLDLLLWFTSPGEAVVSQPGNTFNLDLTEVTAVNCSFDDYGHHVPTNSDPQLFFPFSSEKEIQSVAVHLAQPLNEQTYVQVFFGFTEMLERLSVSYYAKAGTKEFYFNFPKEQYQFLRLDLNADCWLDAVTCSDEPAAFLRTPPFRPWRILLITALLGLSVFIFTRASVKTILRKLNYNWLNPETRRPIVTVVYAAFAMLMLLHHIAVTLWYPAISKGSDITFVSVLFVIFALVSIPLGQMWKDKGFWFLFALVLLEYLRLAIPTPVIAADFSSIFYALFGCYSVARALGPKAQKPFLKTFCIVFSTAVLILSVLGIYAAWTGETILNFNTGAIVIGESQRLHLIYYYGISGILLSVALSVALIGLSFIESNKIRFFGLIVCAVLTITSCLTVTRTAYVSTAIAISLFICLLLHTKSKPRTPGSRNFFQPNNPFVLLCLFILITIGLIFIQTYIPDGFFWLRSKSGLILSKGLAEESAPAQSLIHRDILNNPDLNSMSSNRIYFWERILRITFTDPSYILWGQSIHQPTYAINEENMVQWYWRMKSHAHNLWLQTLLESGIPGLLIFLSSQIYFLIHAFRLMKNKDLSFWKRLLPIPVIAVLVSELFDHTVNPNDCFPQLTILYIFIGFTVAVSQQINKPCNALNYKK